MDWFKIGKGVSLGCILPPCLFNLCRAHHVECWAGWVRIWNQDFWKKYQQSQRNICYLRYVDDDTVMEESKEELKSLLMSVKDESEKAAENNIQKAKTMASGPITSGQIDGEKVETVTDSIFLSSKITADGDCSCEIKRHLLLGRKTLTNLDSVLKSRPITLLTRPI